MQIYIVMMPIQMPDIKTTTLKSRRLKYVQPFLYKVVLFLVVSKRDKNMAVFLYQKPLSLDVIIECHHSTISPGNFEFWNLDNDHRSSLINSLSFYSSRRWFVS